MTDYGSEVRAMGDPKLAEFTAKLVPGKDGIVGVRIPALRALAKRIVKEDWRGFLEEVPGSYEEEILRGIVIATAPTTVDERISMTEGFLPMIDNWATCDTFCGSWKVSKRDMGKAWDYLASLIDTGEEYPMRVSLIARKSLFRDRERMSLLAEDIAAHDHPGYYYRMGAAWAASEIFIRFPDLGAELLESRRMEPWTHDMTIRKICESRRVTDDQRTQVRALRTRRAP